MIQSHLAMSYSNQVILQAVRDKCALLPEENSAFQEILVRAIVQILSCERDRQIRYMNIQKEVRGACTNAARQILEHQEDARGMSGNGA